MLAPKAEVGSWVSEAAREKFMAAYERAFALGRSPSRNSISRRRPRPRGCTPTGRIPAGSRSCCSPGPGSTPRAGTRTLPRSLRPARYTGSTRPATRTPASCAPRSPRRSPARPGWMSCSASSATSAHLVGLSWGGSVAMNQAIRAPRAGRLHHPARPRRAHQARRPLLVVVHHQRPGQPDPDAAAPPPRPVAGQPGHAGARADDAHVGRQPRLPDGAEVPRHPHRRRTPRDQRAGPADHRRAQREPPAEAHARGSLMPHAEVGIVPGSHGGFNRITELNDRIAAFIHP